MIESTHEQRQVMKAVGWPPEIMVPNTGKTFVLISKEMFERVRTILEGEDEIAAIEEMYPLVSEVLTTDDSSSRESA